MTALPASGAPGTLPIPEPVPQLLRDLIHERTGLYFELDRLDMMVDKLQPRVLANACASYLDYYYLLKYDGAGAGEWLRVMDAFSVQETYFWREFDQIRLLVDHLVPQWFQRTDRPLRIWSAACATGEEPYSIVMALLEAGWGAHPIEVHASDASEAALARARAAVYRERSFRALPAGLRAKYFTAQPGGDALHRDVANRVTFRWANLLSPDGFADLQDVRVIFCRNVFIYFSTAAIKRVVASFAQRIPEEGCLLVGASESLLKLTDEFELQDVRGAFAYVRKTAA